MENHLEKAFRDAAHAADRAVNAALQKYANDLVTDEDDITGVLIGELVEQVASTRSWAAKEWLGIKDDAEYRRMSDEHLAERFFLGDIDTLRVLRKAYRGTKT